MGQRQLNNLGMFVFLAVLAAICLIVLIAANVVAEEPASAPTSDQLERVERSYLWLFRNVWKKDRRIRRSKEMADILTNESIYYRQDPFMGMSVIFHESSWRPGDESIGGVGEWGLAQTHGAASKLCLPELKRRGVDPKSERGQIICSILNLNKGVSKCGFMVKDEDLCLKKWKNPGKACNGSLSYYRTGSCTRARKSRTVAFGVSRRLQTRNSLKRESVISL